MEWLNLDDSVNALSLLGAAVIVVLTILVAGNYLKQMKDTKAEGDLADGNWDGIGEFKNNVPTGYMIVWMLTIVWGLWYWFLGYPLNAFSQVGMWNDEVKEHQAKFESKWANADETTLQQMGENLFLVQCAPCHGVTAEGLNGKAQNLAQWSRENHIVNIVQNGANGLSAYPGGMPPQVPTIEAMFPGEDSMMLTKAAAAYVVDKFTPASPSDAALASKGKQVFDMVCAACHGMDGNGMAQVAPSLKGLTSEVLDQGYQGNIGKMPSFNHMLTDVQKKALNHYIYSL